MTSLICGSLAFDTIMSFDGRFSEAILADQLHKVNVAFLVPALRREFGGCAGNIAYNLKLLGGDPRPVCYRNEDNRRRQQQDGGVLGNDAGIVVRPGEDEECNRQTQ